MALGQAFHIHRDQSHGVWNHGFAPAIEVDPGAVVTFEVNNASGGQLDRRSTVEHVAALDLSRVNPVTGPVFVRGAEPGDALMVDILAVDLEDWGWTANIPGFGLLADQFKAPHLRISQVTAHYAELLPGLRIPASPFIGTIGVAPADPGDHSVVPPRRVGGNMDMRHVTPGARLVLPVEVAGALLSLGDTHAAQGDGEVCGTAIEASSVVTLRVGLRKGQAPRFPILHTHPRSARPGRAIATTGIGPDLFQAARDATSSMIDHISRVAGLDPADAYLLCSVAADLKISEIVDQPHWVVSLHLEGDVLGGGAA
jgi:acetamidase/formamidase